MELTPVSLVEDDEPRTPESGASAPPGEVWGDWRQTRNTTPGQGDEGKWYFFNAVTNETRWTPPPGWPAAEQQAPAPAPAPAPPPPAPQAWKLQLLHLSSFALWGTLLRCALVSLFGCYSSKGGSGGGDSCRSLNDGVLYTTVVPNLVGCFIMGLMSSPHVFGDAPSQLAGLPAVLRAQRLSRLHLGLRTGLCGSLTSWASWNNAMTLRAAGGEPVRALLGYLFGTLLSGAGFYCGQQAAAALCERSLSAREQEDERVLEALPAAEQFLAEDGAAAALLFAALALSFGFNATAHGRAALQTAGQAALLAPLGVALRWQLVSRLNAPPPRAAAAAEDGDAAPAVERPAPKWLPAGTLTANTLACLFDAALSAWVTRAPPGAQRAHVADVWMSGFAGALSTVSSVAAETASLFAQPVKGARRGYSYLTLTWLAGYFPSLALFLIFRKPPVAAPAG